MNKQIKVALFTAIMMVFCTGSAIAQSKVEPKQEVKKQHLKQIKETKAQRDAQLKKRKKYAVKNSRKNKLRAKK
jgi:hypothetical protein